MNKDEFKKTVDANLTLAEGEFDKLWGEKEIEAKEMLQTTDTEQIQKTTLNKLYVFLSKQLASTAEVYEGIIFGFGDITDFGAEKKYKKIKENWELGNEDIRKSMIENNEVDESGNPLWCEENSPKGPWKYQDDKKKLLPANQRKIDLEREKQRQGLLIAKKNGEEKYFKTMMTLWTDKLDIEITPFKKVKFRATGNLRDNVYKLNSASVTEFVVLNDENVPSSDLNDLVGKYFTDNIVDLNETSLSDWMTTHENERIVILKNCVPTRVTLTDASKSNVVNIGNPSLGFEDDSLITCWVPNSYSMNVAEGDSDVIVFGNVNKGLDGKISVNTYSFYNPNDFVKPKPVEAEEKQEEVKEEKKKW